jgi:hypothetical protein
MIQRVESSMKGVFSGRYIAEVADPVILFVICMRVNRLLTLHRWLLPTFNTLRLRIHLQKPTRRLPLRLFIPVLEGCRYYAILQGL